MLARRAALFPENGPYARLEHRKSHGGYYLWSAKVDTGAGQMAPRCGAARTGIVDERRLYTGQSVE